MDIRNQFSPHQSPPAIAYLYTCSGYPLSLHLESVLQFLQRLARFLDKSISINNLSPSQVGVYYLGIRENLRSLQV